MSKLRVPVSQKVNIIHKTGKEYNRKKLKEELRLEEKHEEDLCYLQNLIMNDCFAITFQTIIQYRQELLRVYNLLDIKSKDIRFKKYLSLIDDDADLSKFQKMFQYRTVLIKALTKQ